jgi:hypothetical protein
MSRRTARPRPSPDLTEREWQIARERAAKAPPLTPAQLQELAAIFRAAGWARLPASGDGDHDDEG